MTDKEKNVINHIRKGLKDYPTFFRTIKKIIIVFTIMPIFIWLLYLVGHHFVLIPTDITAGETLSFYGSILSFIGTVCLSALALWQNEKANIMNQRLTKLQLEEYTPYLKILSFQETLPDPARCPDTTQSVLSRSSGYIPKEVAKKYEEETEELLRKCSIKKPEDLNPEKIAQMKAAQIELHNKMKLVPSFITEKFYEIFWITERGTVEPIKSFTSIDSLEKLSYRFAFKNESKAKIKEIIIEQIEMNNTMNKWLFKPYELHNKISELILQGETVDFNINIYWNTSDKDLTYLINCMGTDISFKFKIITIGNNEQKENVAVSIWAGKLSNSTYQLI